MKFEVTNRYTGYVQFVAEIDCDEDAPSSVKLGLAVKWAVKSRADLAGAYLAGADLAGADLARANLADASLADADLADADLAGAYLAGAYLAGADLARANLADASLADADLADADLADADLAGADLARADLAGAYLARANLARANLAGAYLARANLARANLADASLSYADLADADLADADLAGAYLAGADLAGAKGADLVIARTRILPDGDLIGWKSCQDGVIVKLRIPAEARRSHAFGRKCRAEFADCIDVFGAPEGVSRHDRKTVYRPGERVHCDEWCEDWRQECAGGIHFFITREEAEAWI